ncbi:hypothetical protein [Ferrovibrio sp.]|uniref:hypothetical protein n=1 Tax=Ferrovibrio sp. TaxID=1917215 RepID=UPI0025BD4B55|nr:hypothetical protein [Ferrovibrio sp.]MBX3456304.1 hypothetical protein [Ferrovibrio sp.]
MCDLLILITEAGAASFLRPVVRALQQRADLNWVLAATPVALRGLADDVPATRLLWSDLDRTSAAMAGDILDMVKPRRVLASAGGWPLERAVIRLAKQRSIVAAQFVDTWYGYRRRFLEGADALLPDHLLVIDPRAVAEAEADGLPADKLHACGHPLWSEIALLPPIDSRATLFIGAPVKRDYGNSLGYTEDDAWACLLEVAQQRPDLVSNLEYAPHPEQQGVAVSAPISSYSTGRLADIGQVVGMFSAPLIEAYIAGRRSISLQPRAGSIDMAPLSRFGLSPRVTGSQQLIEVLEAPLPDNTSFRADMANGTARFLTAIEECLPA